MTKHFSIGPPLRLFVCSALSLGSVACLWDKGVAHPDRQESPSHACCDTANSAQRKHKFFDLTISHANDASPATYVVWRSYPQHQVASHTRVVIDDLLECARQFTTGRETVVLLYPYPNRTNAQDPTTRVAQCDSGTVFDDLPCVQIPSQDDE